MRISTFLTLAGLATLTASSAFAQLAAPNSTGVAMGHIHLYVKDIAAEQQFFEALGGKPVNNEKLQMVQFPGVFIVFRKADNEGGTAGSTVNHFGFFMKSVPETVAKMKAAGYKVETANNPGQAFVTGPQEIRVELYEDAAMAGPVRMHHVHLFVPDPKEAQAWYDKNFGATAGKRGQYDTSNVPGAELTMAKSDTPQATTKGRVLDHIGFEVASIDDTVKRLQAAGIAIENNGVVRTSPNASKLHIAFLTDPWGTYIELTQGLTP
jgi:catechol 2,3-dioxygenase-like lactoylglutathione lyase family enzyme